MAPLLADDVLEIQLAKAFTLNKQLYAPVFARLGIETYHLHALLRLAADDGLPQVELGRLMLRDKVAITRLVAELEAKGLVKRCGDGVDTRLKRCWLTPKARKLVPRAIAAYTATSAVGQRTLSPKKRDQLMALLRELQRGYRQALDARENRRTA